jgi:hypothetical protein
LGLPGFQSSILAPAHLPQKGGPPVLVVVGYLAVLASLNQGDKETFFLGAESLGDPNLEPVWIALKHKKKITPVVVVQAVLDPHKFVGPGIPLVDYWQFTAARGA